MNVRYHSVELICKYLISRNLPNFTIIVNKREKILLQEMYNSLEKLGVAILHLSQEAEK